VKYGGDRKVASEPENQSMKRQFSVVMRPDRTTSGTYLYAVPGDKRASAEVKNLYVGKTAFADMQAPPGELTVTVSYDDGKTK